MTDSEFRSRFNFGAPASWSTATSRTNPVSSEESGSQPLPGAYIPDDPVDGIPVPEPPPQNATYQNPDKTCRICLSGAEDGASVIVEWN